MATSTNTPISVHQMFNGPGYDVPWLLRKAERELDRAMEGVLHFMENACNFSVTIAHAADWAYALKIPSVSHCTSLSDVINWVHQQSPQTALFFDISNEYKHADRTRRSKTTLVLEQSGTIYPPGSNPSLVQDGRRLISTSDKGYTIEIEPTIKDTAGNAHNFKDCADEAIRWWRSVL